MKLEGVSFVGSCSRCISLWMLGKVWQLDETHDLYVMKSRSRVLETKNGFEKCQL